MCFRGLGAGRGGGGGRGGMNDGEYFLIKNLSLIGSVLVSHAVPLCNQVKGKTCETLPWRQSYVCAERHAVPLNCTQPYASNRVGEN